MLINSKDLKIIYLKSYLNLIIYFFNKRKQNFKINLQSRWKIVIFFALVKLSSGSHLCMVSLSVSFYESHSCRMAAEVNVLEIDAILK